MSLTFIHTSDWHLGFLYRRLGARAQESYQWRFDAVERIFDLARSEHAQFIVVAGDVFHTASPTAEVQHQAVELLRAAPCPVYLIPGNHDPDAPGGVWRDSVFAQSLAGHPQVHLLLKAKPRIIAENKVILFPCPLEQSDATVDPTAWIPRENNNSHFRIGLAHGQWRGYFGPMEKTASHQIDPSRTDACNLDYLALGDYHSFTPANHPAAAKRTYYSGTPEITARDEPRSGHALLVKMTTPSAPPTVTAHAVSTLRLCHWGDVLLQAGQAQDELERRFAEITDPQQTIITGRLRGSVEQGELYQLQQWLNEQVAQIAGLDLDYGELRAEPSLADFDALEPGTAERQIWEILEKPLDGETLPDAGAEIIAAWSEDAPVRREAQTLFYQLLSESRTS